MSVMKTLKLKVRKSKKTASYKKTGNQKKIAIAGNPNVGKSTVFNALTGLNQHTGNWPGKTVECAGGNYVYKDTDFKLTDIPGTYSLMANSPEEEIARDFICFENPDAVIVTLDATCLERNLNLALQILEVTKKVVLCVNLIDEAKRKKIEIDLDELSLQLGVPAVATNARSGKGLGELMDAVYNICEGTVKTFNVKNDYGEELENFAKEIESILRKNLKTKIDLRWLSFRLLENDDNLTRSVICHLKEDISKIPGLETALSDGRKKLNSKNMDPEAVRDTVVRTLVEKSEKIYKLCVKVKNFSYDNSDRATDKLLTSKITGFPIMILMLLCVFWITLTGANYPSELIASALFRLQDKLMYLLISAGTPPWFYGIMISGVYRTLAWVVSVMLPPMAIFFPLFTLLEDVGYLPRVAFNLDKVFKNSGAHGKQALTMCMGFGCNACGIIGCRIIDSPRERLIALLTNNFVPCNGRFPLLISIITMFFISEAVTPLGSFISTLILTGVIVFGIFMTFLISKILSKTILKGIPSSFILELPPYRRPQFGKIIVRSVLDRTIFVLGRAIAVAAPAGLAIWLMANITINDISIFAHCSGFLDPFAKLMGLDGVILMAFILAFPANEIVFPIIIMSYMCMGSILALESPSQLHDLLVSNGWTYITAVCVMLFSLMHFPCGTTCLTIKKETGSLKWMALAFVIPTVCGILTCFVVSNVLKIIQTFV